MKDNTWSEIFRYLITTLVFGFYIASVFFVFSGNYQFLTTFEYWNSVITSTMFAFFLRWLWSFKGLEVRLQNNDKISKKQDDKSLLIEKIIQNNLTEKLEEKAISATLKNKKKAYNAYVDKKIKRYTKRTKLPLLKQYRMFKLEKWKQEKLDIGDDGFNWDIVKVDHYEYDIDYLLTSFYRDTKNTSESRSSLGGKVLKSYRTNILTFVFMAVFTGLDVFLSDFQTKELYVLLGKVVMFLININNGYNLGKSFVDVDYSRDLTKDHTFLRVFLDNNLNKKTT